MDEPYSNAFDYTPEQQAVLTHAADRLLNHLQLSEWVERMATPGERSAAEATVDHMANLLAIWGMPDAAADVAELPVVRYRWRTLF